MALTQGNVASGGINGTTLNVTHTLAGAGPRLVLILITHDKSRTVSSMTYGGKACTLLGGSQNANGGSKIYYLEGVTSSGTASVTVVGSNPIFMAVVDFDGADTPTDYQGQSFTAGATGSTINLNNVVNNDILWDGIVSDRGATVGADQTNETGQIASGGEYGNFSSQAGSSGNAMSWTWSSGWGSHSACRIPEAGGAPTIITAEGGSYAYSGQAANINRALLVAANAGAYAYTGQDAGINLGLRVSAEAGAYAYAGQDVTLSLDHVIAAEAGAYSWAGQNADLVKTLRLIAEAGAYSWAGQQVAILASRLVSAEAGSYAWTGQDAAILRAVLLEAEGGAYAYTGGDATITVSAFNTIVASAGNYSWLGQQADLLLDRILTAHAGAYNWNGQPANIILPSEEVIAGGLPRRGRRRFVLPDGRVFYDPDEALFELHRLLARTTEVEDIKPIPARAKKKTQPRKRKGEPKPEPIVNVQSAIMKRVETELPELIDARPTRAAPIDPTLISVLLQRVDDREAEMLLL